MPAEVSSRPSFRFLSYCTKLLLACAARSLSGTCVQPGASCCRGGSQH